MSRKFGHAMRMFAAIVCLVVADAPPMRVVAAEDAEKLPEPKLDESTVVVLDKEINGLPAGTKLISSPSYMQYSLHPVVDGVKHRMDLGWQECSWASEEDESPHGIEIRLSKPSSGGRFQITWAYDIHNEEGGRWWISREYVVQIKNKAESPWKTVVWVKNNQSAIGSHPLPDEPFRFLRVVQPPGGGHRLRPNIMWVGQVELTE